MKKKILKIGALVLAVLMIVGVAAFANSLVGNPISKALAKNTAEKYIESTYGDTDYELENISYSFKDGYYHALISSPSSMDTYFSLVINGFGKLKYDNYDYNVTNGWNTAFRIDRDYRKAVETVFESSAFTYNAHIAFGEIAFTTEEQSDDPYFPDYALRTDDLKLDAYYNANDIGSSAGKLTVYIEDNTVTAERLAQILLGIRECFDSAGIGFYAIDCVLEYPLNSDGLYEYGRVEVMDFLYSDISPEGLTERVMASNDAANAYYNEQDVEKFN